MKTIVKVSGNLSNKNYLITSGGEPLVKAADGDDLSLNFSPVQVFLASIAMCKVSTARGVAVKEGISFDSIVVTLELVSNRDEEKKYSSQIKTSIEVDGDISAEQEKYLKERADNCYIAKLLPGDWSKELA